MNIVRPSNEQVSKYLEKWDSNVKYVTQESSLKKLFTETYPKNVDMYEILIKVCSLNSLYSTNIFYPFAVAQHIYDLNIDQRLSNGDQSLVNEIALVTVDPRKKPRNLFSFATKYCSHHFPKSYSIYDNFVEKTLVHFKKEDNFFQFYNYELKIYPKYHAVLKHFIRHYGLERFDRKQIDMYLWQVGKEKFSK